MAKPRTLDVRWSSVARADLESIVGFVAEADPSAALTALDRLERAAGRLATFPFRGRVVPELAYFGIQTYRELVVSPWRVFYRVSGTSVLVVAVLDSRRNLEDVLLERFMRETESN